MKEYLKGFVQSYIETALWASSDNLPAYDEEKDGYTHPEPLDEYLNSNDEACLSISVLKNAVRDCKAFIEKVEKAFSEEDAEYILNREGRDLDYIAPHDFFLTRNGHGAGFWDGDWDEYGDKLTEIAKSFGEMNLYIGDDGNVYC